MIRFTRYSLPLLFSALTIGASVKAQTNDGLKHCGQTEAMKDLYARHPELKQHAEAIKQQQAANTNAPLQKTATTPYIIPIVFHIMHEYGTENISDAQVIDEVRILNEDYQLRNADTTTIVSSFQSLKANINVEFRLAKIDPNGNCTNGIIHVATPYTNIGDDHVKYDQWDPSKYLNVWVVKTMMSGAAGYAYYPSTADGWPQIDGVVILSTYIGSIGTGTYYTGRALTHEIGHYLDLEHVWGDNNNPGQACGDDGVSDTPVTMGWTSCNLNGSNCTAGVIENVQNYMEYSYCSRMFSLGQKQRMTNALNSTVANRSNLWSNSNLLATGTDNASYTSTVTCKPIADFKSSTKNACQGSSITFSDVSYNGAPTSWSWSFSGGTPSTSTSSTQVVTYNTPGVYPVKLVVSNAQGLDSITKTSYVYIQPTTSPNASTISESFETITIPNTDWIVNSGADSYTWQMAAVGATGSKSIKINNRSVNIDGDVDEIISPSLNLANATNYSLTFKVAYAETNSSNTDKLRVLSSKNCGTTWDQRYVKTGATLATTTSTLSSPFTPTASQWRTETISLPSVLIGSNTMFKFEFTSGGGNNIYIDDINVSFPLSTNDLSAAEANLTVMPNPFSDQAMVRIQSTSESNMHMEMRDLLGKVVYTQADTKLSVGENSFSINKNELSQGVYFLNVIIGNSQVTKKVVIQ